VGEGRLIGVLSGLEAFFARYGPSADFLLVDRECSDDFEWLEYRRVDAAGTVLLSIHYSPRMHTITAELWWPTRLVEGLPLQAPGSAIEQRQSWDCASVNESRDLEHAIVDAVGGWLALLWRDQVQSSRSRSARADDRAPRSSRLPINAHS
jgi:hypothetical protein